MADGGWTKGPWSLTPDDTRFLVTAPDDGDPEAPWTVAVVCGYCGPNDSPANARLIAACPEMASYIQQKADEGDAEAARIMEVIHAGS